LKIQYLWIQYPELQYPSYTTMQHGLLLQLLTDAQATMARIFEQRARHLGLTRPQWRVLAGLYGNDGMTQSELSEHISIARSPLGKIVDQLERIGYVERQHDPDDRRINRLFITGEVEPLLQPARELAIDLEQRALDGVPTEAPFVEQLAYLTERLQAIVRHDTKDPRTA
jgi:MarR family transcriptional regulator for hemolysin